jgi:protein SCO1/2
MRRYLPAAAVLAAWITLAGWWTFGFRAFTTDSAALAAAGPLPRPASPLTFIDATGDTATLARYRGRYLLLTFMYLHCPGVCQLVTQRLRQAEAELADAVPERVLFLSVSLDPERDDSAALAHHWHALDPGASWVAGRLARPLDHRQLADLARLGVWVSRDPSGRIDHAASTFLLDPAGDVVEVFRPEVPASALVAAVRRRLS